MLLDQLRHEICRLHAELPRNNLVAWTSGNVSGRDPEIRIGGHQTLRCRL